MYFISNEILAFVSGGGSKGSTSSTPSNPSGGTATVGNTTINCPPGRYPIIVSGNLSGTFGGVALSGGGNLATCMKNEEQEPKKAEKASKDKGSE